MKVFLVWERDEDIGQGSAIVIDVDIGGTSTSAQQNAEERRADALPGERVKYAVSSVKVEPPKRGWR